MAAAIFFFVFFNIKLFSAPTYFREQLATTLPRLHITGQGKKKRIASIPNKALHFSLTVIIYFCSKNTKKFKTNSYFLPNYPL